MLEPRPLKSGLGEVRLESEALQMRLHGLWTVRAGGTEEPHSHRIIAHSDNSKGT